MSYIFRAVLGNPQKECYGEATLPFPIPNKEYDHTIQGLLAPMEIGDPAKQDCMVKEMDPGCWPVLKCLEGQCVNVDELDYLAKRLDSFSVGEDTQYLAMADKLKLTNIKDLINLTFCCQEVTVISDFSKLEEAGREHYMNIHGGSCTSAELERVDGLAVAQELLRNGKGTVTPYGLLFDNGMEMEQLYMGQEFPPYAYDVVLIDLRIASPYEPKDAVWLGLPMLPSQIQRTIQRCGMENIKEFYMEADAAPLLSAEILDRISLKNESITSLNEMCISISKLSLPEMDKLWAAVKLADPKGAIQIRRLADNLDLFNFVAGVKDVTQLGGYMISQSGRFEYDSNLDEYYDFEKYGREMQERESGRFTADGYISYQGAMPLEELMMEAPTEAQQREAEVQAPPPPSGPIQGQQMF